MNIKIKYFNKDYPRLERISKGDYIDLRADKLIAHTRQNGDFLMSWMEGDGAICTGGIEYRKGDVLKLGLGVAMELPEGHEAIVVPRSSTYKHWGFIQTNSPGVIDNSYCGDGDQWMVEFIAMRDGSINRFDRVCQFRIQKNQPEMSFEEVGELTGKNRGGYGSTGTK